MDVERVALEALQAGLSELSREDRSDGRSSDAIAVDMNDEVAAVLVVRRLDDQTWQVDTVMFRSDAGRWVPTFEGGGEWPRSPLPRFDSPDDQVLDLVGGCASVGEHVGHHAAAGFVPRQVAEIEIAVGDDSRRVAVDPVTGSCAVCLVADHSDPADPDAVDVRAFDVDGRLVDSTSRRRRRFAEQLPGVTVAEALSHRDGTSVTVRGFLLVLAGHGPQLCDRIDPFEEPPRPAGASLLVSASWTADLPFTWTPGQNGMELSLMVIDGTISRGVLTVVES